MGSGDANRWPIQAIEGLIRDDRNDFTAPTAKPRILLYREQVVGAANRFEYGLHIQRNQRPDVDHLTIDATLRLQLFGGGDSARHHKSKREDGCIFAGPDDSCSSQG